MTHVTRAQEIVEDVRQLPADERMDVLRGVVGLVAPSLSADQENGVTEALDEAERGETVDGVAALAGGAQARLGPTWRAVDQLC